MNVGLYRSTKRADSPLEAMFALQLKILRQERFPDLPPWRRNHVFLLDRKKQLDFAWPEILFGVEIDGAVHRTEERFHTDREKAALALLAGWKILPVTGLYVRNLQAIGWAETMLRRLTQRAAG